MGTKELLGDYLRALIRKWYVTGALIVELSGLLVLTAFGVDIPRWVYPASFGLAFFIANFLVYRDAQQKAVSLKEKYEAENQSLNERIQELEDQRPQLRLFLQTGGKLTRHRVLTVSPLPEEPEYEKLLAEEAEELPPLEHKPPPDESVPPAFRGLAKTAWQMQTLGRELKDPDKYEAECEDYLQSYRQYLRRLFAYEVHQARGRSLHFTLENTGKVPADEITVILHFPDGFRFYAEETISKRLELQEPPEAPKRPNPFKPNPLTSLMDSIGTRNIHDWHVPPYTDSDLPPPNVTGPFIEPDKSTQVSYDIRHLRHNFTVGLESVEFFVTDEAVGHVSKLEYSIHAANLPEPIEDSLLLEVQSEE